MATPESKVTMDGLVSATLKYSNKDDSNRTFDISADVNISNGKVTNYNNGNVLKKDGTSGNANFSAGNEGDYFNFNANNWDKETVLKAMESIYAFMEKVSESIKENQVNIQ